jgi:epoxide hydrolase
MTDDSRVQPFRVAISQAKLDDLHGRLARTRWIDELPGTGWERGVPPSYLKELAGYWADRFDWAKQEAALNEIPQYTTEIDGQNVHFLHIRSPRDEAIPLLLIHGWPGSPADFLAMTGPLTTPAEPGTAAFHLVIPSLPGHAFSGPVTEPGWNDGRVAAALAELMARLGYDRYGVHGGDHGAFLAPRIARDNASHVIGVHVNALVTFPAGDPADMAALSDADRQRLAAMKQFQDGGSAYMQLAGTRPATIAQLLADYAIRAFAEKTHNITRWTEFGSGGHFPALETPGLLTGDIRAFFGSLTPLS